MTPPNTTKDTTKGATEPSKNRRASRSEDDINGRLEDIEAYLTGLAKALDKYNWGTSPLVTKTGGQGVRIQSTQMAAMMFVGRTLALAGMMAIWSGTSPPDHSALPVALTDDQIVVTGAKARDRVVSLVHGQTDTDVCPDGTAIKGKGKHTIANVTPPSACQVAVLSKYYPVIEVTPAWTNGADAVPVALAGALPLIEVNVFVATNDQSADGVAHADLDHTRRDLRRNRVGLSLKESSLFPRARSPHRSSPSSAMTAAPTRMTSFRTSSLTKAAGSTSFSSTRSVPATGWATTASTP